MKNFCAENITWVSHLILPVLPFYYLWLLKSSRGSGGIFYLFFFFPLSLMVSASVPLWSLWWTLADHLPRPSGLPCLCRWPFNLTSWAETFASLPIEAKYKTSNDKNEYKISSTISRWKLTKQVMFEGFYYWISVFQLSSLNTTENCCFSETGS